MNSMRLQVLERPPHLKLNSISLRAARWYYLEFYYNHPLGLHFLISTWPGLCIFQPLAALFLTLACLSAAKRALCQFSSISQQLSSNFMDIVGTNAWFSPTRPPPCSHFTARARERERAHLAKVNLKTARAHPSAGNWCMGNITFARERSGIFIRHYVSWACWTISSHLGALLYLKRLLLMLARR